MTQSRALLSLATTILIFVALFFVIRGLVQVQHIAQNMQTTLQQGQQQLSQSLPPRHHSARNPPPALRAPPRTAARA
jgi:predicted PurR-regulated permease PerM